MKFSVSNTNTTITPPPPPPLQKTSNYFLSQVHQPFFLFGVIWAIVSMSLFTVSHKGVVSLSIAENIFHFYSLTFIVFIQFFHGFLFTTYPRFCMSEPIAKEEYIPIVFLYQFGALLFFTASIFSSILILFGIFTLFLAHTLSLRIYLGAYRNGKSPLKSDPFWFLVAHGFGLLGHILILITLVTTLIGSPIDLFFMIDPIAINLFLVFITFIAAQRMIPFFSHSQEVRPEKFVAKVFVLMLLKTAFAIVDLPLLESSVSILLALFLLKEFLRWKLPLFHASAILWILYLALFWLPLGLFLGALAQIAEALTQTSWLFMGTHLLTLGFITTVLIGFGTRVTLGHSGQTPYADTLTKTIFWWTQIVVLVRALVSINTGFGMSFDWLFDIASFAWLLLFIAWSGRYAKSLIFKRI